MAKKLMLIILALIYLQRACSVSIPPKIIEQGPKDIFYKEGESVKITCKASGVPTPKYYWTRADKDFAPEGNEDRVVKLLDEGTIIINRPEDKDEGFYQCFARNSFGIAATIKFNLRQAKLKEFPISNPRTYTPQLGTPLTLKCPSTESVPDGDIYWAVGHRPVLWDARVSVDYDDSLHFTYIDASDYQDGQCFHCVATNTFMRKSVKGPQHCIQPVGKTLTMAPMRLAWPDSQYDSLGMLGESVKLKCIFSGYPTPTVIWSKKGSASFNERVKTGNSGGQELIINDLKYEDSGTYVCSAFKVQSDRREEMSIVLNVESAPKWVIKPQDVTMGEGGTAQFECDGEGVPAVKIHWFINGKELEEVLKSDKRLDKDRFQSSKNRIVLQNIRLTDTMVVQCNVTNNNGFLWGEAFLNVLEEKPSILEVPEDTRVAEGQDFQLACKITGKPDPIITWFKDGFQVTGGRYLILESGSLSVTTAVLSDAGDYVCHAYNRHGEVEAGARVIVRRKTMIEMAPMDLEVQRGVNAKFTCSGTTDPQEITSLKTAWLKDGKSVELGTRMFLNYQDSSLTISGTEERDTGTYTCVVSNALDNDTKSARLVVTDLPLRNTRLEIKNNCAKDMEAELSWMPGAFNNAPIQYFTVEYQTTNHPDHWIYVKQVNYTSVKAFIPLAAGLEYSFRVTSYNKIGASPPSDPSTTRCVTRPRPPTQNPRNVRTIGDMPGQLHIEWTPVPPEHQGGAGFYYIINILKVGEPSSTTFTARIKDWRTYSFNISSTGESYVPYQIGIRSTNDAGNSTDSSPAIIGHSSEGMPEVYPTNLIVLKQESEYVTLQWDFDRSEIDKPGSRIKGEFKGFKVQVWEQNRRSDSIINIDLLPEVLDMSSTQNIFSARVHHQKPNMALQARVAVMNNFYVSRPSDVVNFGSDPGLPGPVSYLEDLNVGDQHVNLQWRPSLDNRGDVIGYDIGYQEVQGLRLGELQERIPQIDDPYATTAVLGGLEPSTKYRIFVWARTAAGRSEPYFIERTTAKPGIPLIPRFTIQYVGEDTINVTWWKDAYQESGNVVVVEYMRKHGREWISTNPDASKNWATLRFLEPGLTYSVRIVVTNGASIRRLSETQDVTTRGAAKAYDIAENLGWFLAMLISILLQIAFIILFVICYRKGFRFKPVEGPVETYTDKGHTYSDKSSIPRTSSAFQDPGGYNNDYYDGQDRYDYDEAYDYEHDNRYDDERVGETGYEDGNYDYDDGGDDGGFRGRDRRDNYRQDNSGDYPSRYEDNYPPSTEEGNESSRRYPQDDDYEGYDMDPTDNNRRYAPDRSHSSSTYDPSREPERQQAGYRAESYRTERPRDVKREEPRYYGGRSDSDREEYRARDSDRGQYRDQDANRDLVRELRERQNDARENKDRERDARRARNTQDDTQDYSGTLI
ncbi:neural cell adhesion molecule l1 [Plakobranchus ocellatus]|uniref:Neural cell adhesion molecule l1 n=1 Tax=Plakobranchus ocellatus TaxID=259542 RepID=A0AAV4BE93_9GAST|nr:neural cell adhesion molecule l1 [Plakobranchus ocellatus]